MKKLNTAIIYVQRIADGNSPVNNLPAEEDSVLNNPNVIRCMYFIRDVLEEVKQNNGIVGRKAKNADKKPFPIEALASFVYAEDKAITKFVDQLNAGVDDNIYQQLSYKPIRDWMILGGLLQTETSQDTGKNITKPTEKGQQLGIYTEVRSGARGEYTIVLYGKTAQEYLVQNMSKIINGEC